MVTIFPLRCLCRIWSTTHENWSLRHYRMYSCYSTQPPKMLWNWKWPFFLHILVFFSNCLVFYFLGLENSSHLKQKKTTFQVSVQQDCSLLDVSLTGVTTFHLHQTGLKLSICFVFTVAISRKSVCVWWLWFKHSTVSITADETLCGKHQCFCTSKTWNQLLFSCQFGGNA